jgi:uncharacterized membrane protein
MLRVVEHSLMRFGRDETGGITIEFVMLFPLLLMAFVIFMGYSMASMRSAMILDYAQRTARAYSIGSFLNEEAVRVHMNEYMWNVSTAKSVSVDVLPAPSSQVIDEYGFITIKMDIPVLRLVSVVGFASVFEGLIGISSKLQVRAPIEGRP